MRFGRLFLRIGAAVRLLPALACALLLAGCEVRLGSPVSLFDDERAIATAVSAIQSRFKGPIRALKVVIADDGMIVQAQDPQFPSRLGEWQLTRERMSFVNWDRLAGPHPIEPVNRKFEENLFDLKEVDLAGWPKVADAAIARAALEDKGGVFTIEIARQTVLVPGVPRRAVRWSIEVKSARESARIFANAKGEITGANLNGTIRMRNLNMYQRPELAVDAAAEVREQAGNEPILLKVAFDSTSISFTTTLKDDTYPIAGIRANAVYQWSYNGLQRASGSADFRSSNPEAPFGIGEVDWALLPKIVADARSKLAMPNGRIAGISVRKPTDGVGTPVPLWSIDIEENRERGTYTADVTGAVKTVSLPPSKRKPTAWLETGIMAQTLARIAAEFGPDGKIVKLFIDNDGAKIAAEDPRKPGQLMEVLLREDGLTRWGTPMFEQGKPFAASELEAFTAERIAGLLERTLKELDMPDARVRHVTIGRDVLGISRLGKVTVAILVLTPRGRQGRVVQALDGTVVEVFKP